MGHVSVIDAGDGDASGLQHGMTASVAVSKIDPAREPLCQRRNPIAVGPNAAVFRRDTGLKNRYRFEPGSFQR